MVNWVPTHFSCCRSMSRALILVYYQHLLLFGFTTIWRLGNGKLLVTLCAIPLPKLKNYMENFRKNTFRVFVLFQVWQRLVAASLVANSILGSCSVSSPKAIVRISNCLSEPNLFRREIVHKFFCLVLLLCFHFLMQRRRETVTSPKQITPKIEEENVMYYHSFAEVHRDIKFYVLDSSLLCGRCVCTEW